MPSCLTAIMKSAKSSDLEASISAAASNKRRRSVGFTAAHAGNAAAAVSAAAWASCNVAAAARVTKAPLRGSSIERASVRSRNSVVIDEEKSVHFDPAIVYFVLLGRGAAGLVF